LGEARAAVKDIVSFRLNDQEDAGLIAVELQQEPGINRATRPGDTAGEAAKSFAEAIDIVRPIANTFLSKASALAQRPSELIVEFGLKLTVKAGAILAATEGEGHFKVTITWTKEQEQSNQPG
jgi:hypothetical protein